MIEPMAATVAGAEPVSAANSAHARTATVPRPPGWEPTRLLAQRTILRLIPPVSIRLPTSTNNGIARYGNESRPVSILCGTSISGFICVISRKIEEDAAMENATGTPKKIRPNMATNRIPAPPIIPRPPLFLL